MVIVALTKFCFATKKFWTVTHFELILLEHNLVTVMIIINPFCKAFSFGKFLRL